MPNRCRCFFMSIFFWIGEYYCCLVVVCRAGVRGVASQLCVPCGLSVGGRLTLQRYCAAHGLVNGFGGCCANLRGFCANHRFCGGQSRCPVQGRAYASYQCPLRASRVLLQIVRVRTSAVAVASARTRYLHCCFSRLFVVFYVKGIEFLDGDDFVVPDLSIVVITI